MLNTLNTYHRNIKFTCEENPTHFLDTAFEYKEGKFHRRVHRKRGKLPVHWHSQVPIKWKRNCIIGALHRAKRISTNFNNEVKHIFDTYKKAGYPTRFIKTTINNFIEKKEEKLIPDYLFEERAKVYIKLPYCKKNEQLSKTFIAKLEKLTNFKFIFIISWQTRKIKSLFHLKDNNAHKSHVIYEGVCSCSTSYVGETGRNFKERIAEHENPAHNSEPAKHLRRNPTHVFNWSVLYTEHHIFKRKIAEALTILNKRPSLNKQVQCYVAQLFPLGIT